MANKFVEVNEKIEKNVVEGYQKIEDSVVGGFQKIADKFVGNFLAKEGESVEDAKLRVKGEQKKREEAMQKEMEDRGKAWEELIKKNMEASLNAGKR